MTVKKQKAEEPRKPAKKTCRNKTMGESEESTTGKMDPSLIGEIMKNDVYSPDLKINSHAIEAFKLFFGNRNLNGLVVDCPDQKMYDSLAKTLENIFDGHVTTFYSLEMENIKDYFRQAVFIRFKTNVDIFEGEVTNIKITRHEDKEVTGIELVLKTNKASKTVTVDKYMIDAVVNVNVGDVIYIEPTAGFIKRLGRSESCANEFDLEGDKYVQLNKTPVHLRKERSTIINLHDIDYAINKYNECILDAARSRTDEIVEEYIESGIASFLDSCLIIKSIELFSAAQLCALSEYVTHMPWIKLVLIGDLTKVDVSACPKFPKVSVISAENPLDVLRSKHKNFTDFSKYVEKYIGKINLEVLCDIVNVSADPEDFTELVESQLLRK